MTADTVHRAVVSVIQRILRDSGRPVREIASSDTFTGTLALDSLDLAVMVVGLEQELNVDPFRLGASPVQTVGELESLYREWIAKSAGNNPAGNNPAGKE